jgi:FGGY-family pentulose kinase
MSSDDKIFFIGIDVGTGSARAGLFDRSGRKLAAAVRPIQMWRPQPDFVEQSSTDIWRACCECVREVLQLGGVTPESVHGLGFDATCSLVVLDAEDRPVTVSPGGSNEQNIIVWMDHRAMAQAGEINRGQHQVLQYTGGRVSPEMQTPKLLWLKSHLPESWQRAARFFDLPDFLVYRATGSDVRSLCTTVCKWTLLGHEKDAAGNPGRWDHDYFRAIGLQDLADEGFTRIGTRIRPMGEAVGAGLTPAAAEEMGLKAGTAVAVGIIDAHAGGLGSLGAAGHKEDGDFDHCLALIGGTSSCHMAVSKEPRFIGGIWGPYWSAMVPGYWLTEGGQSATGALIDHVIETHPARATALEKAEREGTTIYGALNNRLQELAGSEAIPAALTRDLHVFPDFHGNRSPRADASLRGMISGLTLAAGLDDLALLYLATIQAVAHGTRHIIEEMNHAGYRIDTMVACGGGVKNPVFLREHADITGCRIILPKEPEAVLLGSAILGATAAGAFASIREAMRTMSTAGEVIAPAGGSTREYHNRKYNVFQRMFADQMAYRKLMAG